jgi:tRNA dimethylallyltransferase
MEKADNEDYVTDGDAVTARPVLIAGPTASGKSALALALAERDGGVVINADASQVYACWRVLTARPDEAELARAPHRLYGHVRCDVRSSAGAWLRDVAAALDDARRSGLRPVVVGGTGLYFAALTEGLAAIPDVPAAVRARSSALLDDGRIDVLLDELARDDPETLGRIDRANPMRVQRAWDVLRATGRGLADWHRSKAQPLVPPDQALRLVVEPDLSMLNNNIARRFRAMVETGALDECRRFIAADLDPTLPSARVLGAGPLIAHLRGAADLDAAVTASVTATRQFAKRQRTWMRNRMAAWTRIVPGPTELDAIGPD